MSITTYVELQTAVENWMNRDDLDSRIPEFVALTEAALQVRCKVLEFESTATITITAGVGTLPTDYAGMRSIYWNGDLKRPMKYITPDRFDAMRNSGSSDGDFYTISGTTIRTTPSGSGSAVMTYYAKFVPLATTSPNALLTNFPDVYLFGTCLQAAIYIKDDADAQKYNNLFSAAIDRVNTHNQDRKYGGPLTVRVR